jgi:hypothetical protein
MCSCRTQLNQSLQLANAGSLPKLTALALCGLGALSLTADATGEFSTALKVMHGAGSGNGPHADANDADAHISALLVDQLSGVIFKTPVDHSPVFERYKYKEIKLHGYWVLATGVVHRRCDLVGDSAWRGHGRRYLVREAGRGGCQGTQQSGTARLALGMYFRAQES